jgi:hypothetical protein
MILFITVAIIGALITNWIRITLLIIIGDYTDMTSSLMTDHNNFGWYIFIPFMVLLFVFGNYLAENLSKSTVKQKNKICLQNNIATLTVIIIGLLVSSTTISNNLIPEQGLVSKSLKEYDKQQELKPFVQYFINISNDSLTIGTHEIFIKTFEFSGYDLDAKPTYYNNKLAPDSWRENDAYQYKQWNIIELEQHSKKSLVATSLQIKTQLFANRSKFKAARIKAGMSGTTATKLHWFTVSCKANCEVEKVILVNALNDFKVIDSFNGSFK